MPRSQRNIENSCLNCVCSSGGAYALSFVQSRFLSPRYACLEGTYVMYNIFPHASRTYRLEEGVRWTRVSRALGQRLNHFNRGPKRMVG